MAAVLDSNGCTGEHGCGDNGDCCGGVLCLSKKVSDCCDASPVIEAGVPQKVCSACQKPADFVNKKMDELDTLVAKNIKGVV